MSDQRTPPEGTPARPTDPTSCKRPVQRVVREDRVVVPPDAGVTPGAVHEEERVGVLPDGSVVRELDRVEQPPVDRRNWLPWAIAVVLLIILAGLAIWYFARDEKATVAPVIGQTTTTAVTRLQQDGFKTQIVRRVSGRRPGTVVGEQPAGGSTAAKGSLVVLTVAAPPTSVKVPNAVGVAQADARDRLVAAGFKVKSVSVSSDQPVGTVVCTGPGSRRDDRARHVGHGSTCPRAARPPTSRTRSASRPTTPSGTSRPRGSSRRSSRCRPTSLSAPSWHRARAAASRARARASS